MAALLQELREKRTKSVADARAIMDRAGKEKRDLTEAESAQVDAAFAEGDRIKEEIAAQEKRDSRSARLAADEADLEASRGRVVPPSGPGRDEGGSAHRRAHPKEDYTFSYQRRGMLKPKDLTFRAGTPEHRRHTPEYLSEWRAVLGLEKRGPQPGLENRALQTDLDTAGGYITAPEEFVMELLKNVDDEVMVRKHARSFTITASSAGVPTRSAKMASAAWGAELTPPTADSALKFGKRALTPHYMSALILVSNDLVRSALMSVDEIVREEIARDTGELEERAFMTGSGAQQPLGVFTPSADGISTARDFATGNAATSIGVDGLIEAKFALKQKYRKMARWMFHRDAVKQIRKLKDAENQYYWEPALRAGEPDTILQLPVDESEWVPNTFTTGLYVGILADWRYYWIVDRLMLDIKILSELYSLTNQVAYLARRMLDGAPTIEEAFARVKLG